ncbi:MAG: ABC transporter substrate-binding protein [Paracoccaceae bacterium]
MKTYNMINHRNLRSISGMYASEYLNGKLDRREFLTRVTSLGITATGAYSLMGLNEPVHAKQPLKQGGTMRMAMECLPLKDPRFFDWTQQSYFTAGTLEYLVEYNNDGSITPNLLESWTSNNHYTKFVLNVRKGVKWNNGDDFTADDVARNIYGWCEKSVNGNSMASRMAALIDEHTGKAATGAIKVTGKYTVELSCAVPDITLVASMADYPAAIVHHSFTPNAMNTKELVGTGPFIPESYETGVKGAIVRNGNHKWWGYSVGRQVALDRIEFIDYGTDPNNYVTAAENGQIDVTYETVGDYLEQMSSLGWKTSTIPSISTIVIRPNQLAEPYRDKRVRQALAMAVDNSVCLELGYANKGILADNSHSGSMHPEHDPTVTRLQFNPKKALALVKEIGLENYEHTLYSLDDVWRKNTADAVAAQLRDAGFQINRKVVPGSTYWERWKEFPFSTTNWDHRPFATQVWKLAYHSDGAWNEFGWSNKEFDNLLDKANSLISADERRETAGQCQAKIAEDGVTIQPYWRDINRCHRPEVCCDQHISNHPHFYKWGFVA